VLRDTLLIYRRYVRQTLRTRVAIVFGLLQPILYLTLFGPLLTKVSAVQGFGGDAWQVYVPGILVQLGLFSAGFVGFGLIGDLRYGVVERLRVTPVHRAALLLGRVLRDLTALLVQAVLLLAAAVALGLRAPWPGVAAGVALMLVMSAGVAALSYALALATRNEDAFAPLLTTALVPLMLLAGIMLPMSLAPRWLDVVSRCTPMRYATDAIRALFRGSYSGATLAEGVAAVLLLAAVSIAYGTRRFVRENR
jgi:ABC-2 type transport system permease protein